MSKEVSHNNGEGDQLRAKWLIRMYQNCMFQRWLSKIEEIECGLCKEEKSERQKQLRDRGANCECVFTLCQIVWSNIPQTLSVRCQVTWRLCDPFSCVMERKMWRWVGDDSTWCILRKCSDEMEREGRKYAKDGEMYLFTTEDGEIEHRGRRRLTNERRVHLWVRSRENMNRNRGNHGRTWRGRARKIESSYGVMVSSSLVCFACLVFLKILLAQKFSNWWRWKYQWMRMKRDCDRLIIMNEMMSYDGRREWWIRDREEKYTWATERARVGIGWSKTVHRANLGDLSGIVGVQEEDGEEGKRGSEVGVFSFFLLISQINTSIHGKVLIRRKVTKVKGPSLFPVSLVCMCENSNCRWRWWDDALLVMCPKS